jgi:serine protease
VVVAVIDTGVTKVADLADTKFVAGFNFISNKANAGRPRPRHARRGDHRPSTNNKVGVAGAAYGATSCRSRLTARLGFGRRDRAGNPVPPTTAPTSTT